MLAEHAVYTIVHPDVLRPYLDSSLPKTLSETKRWVTAATLFNAARYEGKAMAIVFGDATDCSSLKYSGLLSKLTVDENGTIFVVTDLKALRGKRTQELVLRSTKLHIAEGFIRPYAIVQCPSFARVKSDSRNVRRPSQPTAKQKTPSRTPSPTTSVTDAGLTMFSFGYRGAGSATRALVEAIDAAEKLRGFDPPLWVDIRISRSVRAAGFRNREFQDLLETRYEWMRDLGNICIQEKRGGIQIKNPAAAKDLLQLALDHPERRIIFFCSCERPAGCHRHTVAKLILKYAKERDCPITVVEWPGGEPGTVTIDVSPATLHKIERGEQKTLPIPPAMTLGYAASLPWGTIATVRAGTEHKKILIGPAHFNAGGSHIKLFPEEPGNRTVSKSFRAELAYAPVKL